MKKALAVLFSLSLSACSTHMYVAKAGFLEDGKECAAQAYWYKTRHLAGGKADRVLTVNAGGQRAGVQYQERGDGIVYLGEASRDRKVAGEAPQGREFPCGKMLGVRELKRFDGDHFYLTMHCEAVRDELTVSKGYLPAQAEPYRFAVRRETLFSLSGKLPEPPPPPACSAP